MRAMEGKSWLYKYHGALPHSTFIACLVFWLFTSCSTKYVLRSDPSEAEVFFNEKLVGKTPVEISVRELPPTPNIHIKVQKLGHRTFTGIIPNATIASLDGDISISLSRGEDETDKLNRNMGRIIAAQKLVIEGKYTDALKFAEDSIKENDRYLYPQVLKASILFLMKDYSSSLSQWQKVIELEPTNTEAIRMVNYLRQTGGKQ